MQAAIYKGKKSVSIQEIEAPVCGEHDIIVENLYAGICGTDVAVYQHGPNTGHRVTVGGEFGHEVVSRVVAVGGAVKDISIGDIVYPYPRLAKGDPGRAGTIGGFSKLMLIPNCELGRQVYRVDDSIPTKTAALIEPFTVGTRAARRARPQPRETAVVFGAGTIGIAAAIALKQIFGCGRVMLADLSDFRLSKAAALGFGICNPGTEDIGETMLREFGEAPGLSGATANVDIFMDAAGAASVLDTFMEKGKIGSRFVAVAVNNALREVDVLHLTYAQKSIIGSGGYMPQDVQDVMAVMKSGIYNIGSIITHTFPLRDIAQALETAADTDHALNVMIDHTLE